MEEQLRLGGGFEVTSRAGLLAVSRRLIRNRISFHWIAELLPDMLTQCLGNFEGFATDEAARKRKD